MNGLRTARAVVIDDSRDEAIPLLLALGKIGIGALYYDDNMDHLPAEPIPGVRVVFLDIRMFSNVSSDPQIYVPQTLEVLARVVEAKQGATGIVYWTKDPTDITEFEAQLPEVMPSFQPSFTIRIANKAQFVRNLQKTGELACRVMNVFDRLPGFSLLCQWEQAVHDSASSTTGLLADAAGQFSGTTQRDERYVRLICALAGAAGGNAVSDWSDCVASMFEGLNGVQLDQLEALGRRVRLPRQQERRLVKLTQTQPELEPACAARLNAGLLAGTPFAQPRVPAPGDVYVAAGWKKSRGGRFPHMGTRKNLAAFLRELWGGLSDVRLDDLVNNAIPCLLEVTPPCDYAMGKTLCTRMVGGVLVRSTGARPENKKKRRIPPSSRMHAKQTTFMELNLPQHKLEGVYSLVVSARYLHSAPRASMMQHAPAFRLRHQVLSDIQSWFAAHAARPGHVSIP